MTTSKTNFLFLFLCLQVVTLQKGHAIFIVAEKAIGEISSSGLQEPEWRSFYRHECLNADTGEYRCPDKSFSFLQPRNNFLSEYESYCGQTAAANLLSATCGFSFTPEELSPLKEAAVFRDWGPGVHPENLLKGLNELAKVLPGCYQKKWERRILAPSKGSWDERLAFAEKSLLSIERPAALLIRSFNTRYLHWVTFVRSYYDGQQQQCVLNTWGAQYDMPCALLAKQSLTVGDYLRRFSVFAGDVLVLKK